MKEHLFSVIILAVSATVYAQESKEGPIVLKDRYGIIQAMEFSMNEETKGLSDQEFMKQYLKITGDDRFVKSKDRQGKGGYINDHYDQFYKGIKVDGGGYNFHYKDGSMFYAHGHFVKLEDLDVTPTITSEKAKEQTQTI